MSIDFLLVQQNAKITHFKNKKGLFGIFGLSVHDSPCCLWEEGISWQAHVGDTAPLQAGSRKGEEEKTYESCLPKA